MKNEKRKEKAKLKFGELKNEIKTHKSTFIVYVVLRLLVITAMVISFLKGNYENVFVCTLSLILFLAPSFIQSNFGIELPSTLEIIILLFIFAAEILGEMESFYIKYAFWDTMLHTLNGFLCAAVGFALLDVINRNSKIKFKLSPVYLSIVAFCFSMTIGVLWEFFEFGCDVFLHTDMQKDFIITDIYSTALDPTKSNVTVAVNGIKEVYVNGENLGIEGYLDIGLIDTMKDLLVNFIGAVIFSIIGYFYIKGRGKSKFASRFIPMIKGDKKAVKN